MTDNTDDIVERLRVLDASNCMDSDHLHEGLVVDAADEIERLRADLAAAIKQRDEARRLYCVEMSRQSFDPKRFTPEWGANELGWDCFNEGGGA